MTIERQRDQTPESGWRFDRLTLPKTTLTPEGYLFAPATKIARTGTQDYFRTDGSRQVELRLDNEVFRPESMATGEHKPVTHRHPPVGEVDAKTVRTYGRGVMSNLRQDGEFLVADVIVHDAEAVRAVRSGEAELSCAYHQRLIPVAGGVFRQDGHTLDGVEADFIQTNIRYNHLAIEPRARANEGLGDRPVRIRLDSAGNQISEDDTMAMLKIGNEEFDVPDEVAAYVESLRNDNDKLQKEGMMAAPNGPVEAAAEIAALKAENAALSAKTTEEASRADKAEARADAADAKLKESEKLRQDADDADARAARDKERFSLTQAALQASGKGSDPKELDRVSRLDSKELRIEVIKAKSPDLNLDGKSDDYIEAMYDNVMLTPRVDSAAQIAVGTTTTTKSAGQRQDAADVGESAYVKAFNDRKNGVKQDQA